MDAAPRRRLREPFSAISHLAGSIIFAVGLIVLMVLSADDPRALAAFAVYGVCAVGLFLASGLYHSVHKNELWLRRFDHAAIYAMIAGSYTPVCILALPETIGWRVLAIEWGLAFVGIVASLSMELVPHWIRVILYIGMGWLAVAVLGAIRRSVPGNAADWLIAGGLLYTVGVIFYATERPRLWPGKFDAHDLWHLFVLGGAFCHYAFMLYLV